MNPTNEKKTSSELPNNSTGAADASAPAVTTSNNQPSLQAQLPLDIQQLINQVPAASLNNIGSNLLGAALSQQQQNQIALVSQLLQLGQPPPFACQLPTGNSSQMMQLTNLQQQQQLNAIAQMNMLQSMAAAPANNAALALAQISIPAVQQQQMNQILLGLGGNASLGGLLPSVTQNQLPSSILSSTAAASTNNSVTLPTSNIQQAVDGDDDPGWKEQYKALQRYRLVNGHTRVPARYKENPKLGRWVMTQRRQMALHKQGYANTLTADRISMLDEIGFSWSVRPEPGSTWDEKLEELKEYSATFGNTLVPQRYSVNPQLGTWVHTQRRQYKLLQDGKKSSMTQKKIDALTAVGFVWLVRSNEYHNDSDKSDNEATTESKRDEVASTAMKMDKDGKCKTAKPGRGEDALTSVETNQKGDISDSRGYRPEPCTEV